MLGWLTADARAAGPKEYRFPIDEYELSFSVPKPFMSDYWGNPDEMRPELIVGRPGEGTRAILFSNIHMFTGPIWVGNYAAIDFSVSLIEPATTYNGSVSSLEQLEVYEKLQLALPNSYAGSYDFSRKTIAGETWLMMTLIRADSARARRRDDENTILLFPLSDRRYLSVVCRIKEYVPNKTGRWLADAHKMRDQILNSVVLRKRPN